MINLAYIQITASLMHGWLKIMTKETSPSRKGSAVMKPTQKVLLDALSYLGLPSTTSGALIFATSVSAFYLKRPMINTLNAKHISS